MMFSMPGHVRGKLRRIAKLRAIHGLSRPGSRLLMMVSSRLPSFCAEQRNRAESVSRRVLEPDDIRYRREDAGEGVDPLHHVFPLAGLRRGLAEASFTRPQIRAESVLRAICPVPLAYGFAALAERG